MCMYVCFCCKTWCAATWWRHVAARRLSIHPFDSIAPSFLFFQFPPTLNHFRKEKETRDENKNPWNISFWSGQNLLAFKGCFTRGREGGRRFPCAAEGTWNPGAVNEACDSLVKGLNYRTWKVVAKGWRFGIGGGGGGGEEVTFFNDDLEELNGACKWRKIDLPAKRYFSISPLSLCSHFPLPPSFSLPSSPAYPQRCALYTFDISLSFSSLFYFFFLNFRSKVCFYQKRKM